MRWRHSCWESQGAQQNRDDGTWVLGTNAGVCVMRLMIRWLGQQYYLDSAKEPEGTTPGGLTPPRARTPGVGGYLAADGQQTGVQRS